MPSLRSNYPQRPMRFQGCCRSGFALELDPEARGQTGETDSTDLTRESLTAGACTQHGERRSWQTPEHRGLTVRYWSLSSSGGRSKSVGLSCHLCIKSHPRAPNDVAPSILSIPKPGTHHISLPLFDRSNDAFRPAVCAAQRQAVMNQVSSTTCPSILFSSVSHAHDWLCPLSLHAQPSRSNLPSIRTKSAPRHVIHVGPPAPESETRTIAMQLF